MKKELFKSEIFNEKTYNDTRKKYEQMADTLPDLLASISAEGLPTDWGFIDTITHNEGAFREWVERQREERQKGKFLTVSEIQRNADELNEFYNRLAPDVNAIRRMRIERLPMVAVDDSVAVDMEKVEELAKNEATTKVDANRVQEYWDAVQRVEQAKDELRNFEDANNLPSLFDSELLFNKNGNIWRLNYDRFKELGGSAELFAEMTAPYFSRK
jgi:hypothetical protein